MKRSVSLDKLRKDESKKVSYVRTKYRGRFSLNKNESKERRHLRRQDIERELREEEGDGKMEPFRIYNCLPLSREKAGKKDEYVEKEEERKSSEINDDRAKLHRYLKTIMHERGRSTHNVVVMKEHKLTLKANNEDCYAFGDVLWLILRARFHGNIDGHDDGAVTQNYEVNCLREAKKGIVDRLRCLTLDVPPPMDEFEPSQEYIQYLSSSKIKMDAILEEWSSFESLFPHTKALASTFPDAIALFPRLSLLTAVSNTISDLDDKLRTLGILIGVDVNSLPTLSNPSFNFDNFQRAISVFVRNSLTLKGMSKILSRVSSVVDSSMAKAIDLLKLPPKSYADAVMNPTRSDSSPTSIHSSLGESINIPNPLPLFVLIQKIRLALLEEWLLTRSVSFDAHDDSLTMETLIEDSRDCLQQAIGLRGKVMEELRCTCGSVPLSSVGAFDQLESKVFEKYVWYIRMWVEAYSSEGRDTLHSMFFNRIENELGKATDIARGIPDATTQLIRSMIMVCTDLVRRCIVEEWQAEIARVNEEAATYDLMGERDEDEDDEDEEEEREEEEEDEKVYLDDPSVLFTCRMYNKLLRSVQDRTTRVLAIIRRVIEECKNGVISECGPSLEVLANELSNFSMVEWPHGSDNLSLLVDSNSVDCGRVSELIVKMGEGRKIEHGEIILCPVLNWKGRIVRVKDDINARLRFTIPLVSRSSRLLICGKIDGRLKRILRRERTSICSHEVLNQELIHFSKEMLELSETLHSFVTQLSGTYSFSELSPNHIPPFRFTMMRAFDLCMHVYRELSRLLSNSQLESFMKASCNLISDWVRFLKESNPHPSNKAIPLWAMPALTFIQTVSHPSLTTLLSTSSFTRMSADIAASMKLIQRTEEREKVKGEVASPRMKKSSRDEGLQRDERMIVVAHKIDEYVDNRRRRVFMLGNEVVKRREEYTVKNYIDPYRRAVPFKWRMIEQIGKGSYGVVYKAVREDGNGLLAVKMIKVQRELISVLESEVAVMRDLKHVNLVSYYGAEVRGDEVVILMEYCSEGTLEDICAEGMDTALVRKCTHSLLEAVSFIHAHHIVHRDIKPANIFISRSSVLKLGDFGCARRLRGTDTAVGELKHTAGTLNFMSPEVLNYGGENGEKGEYRGYGRACDIWSVGCVVLNLLTGEIPWRGYQWYHIVIKVGKGEKPSYGKAGETKLVSEFLDSCFHHNPDERHTGEMLLKSSFANVQGLSYGEDESYPK